MPVVLRLKRMGAKNKALYRIVAADSRCKRDGRFIETVGQYDPSRKSGQVNVKQDRVDYWLGVGAQASDTVRSLLRKTDKPSS